MYGKGFSDESWSIHRGHPKHGNEGDAIIDTICVINEKERKSSYNSGFSSYTACFCDNALGSGFKVCDNALYDDDLDDD